MTYTYMNRNRLSINDDDDLVLFSHAVNCINFEKRLNGCKRVGCK